MQVSGKVFISIYLTATLFFSIAAAFNSVNAESMASVQTKDVSTVPIITSDSETYRPPSFISVYRTKTGTVSTVQFEVYVKCVVSCEVPGSFHQEAIKAQAVAARTYAFSKLQASRSSGYPDAHPLAPVCDSTHCQAYDDPAVLKNKSGWAKVCSAVEATDSQMLYYNGELVTNALFHASSGGKTENSEDVFVSAVPYLKSVDSPYEEEFTRNGHGVGMSQQGANGMAYAGYSYTEILSHYYTGTVIR